MFVPIILRLVSNGHTLRECGAAEGCTLFIVPSVAVGGCTSSKKSDLVLVEEMVDPVGVGPSAGSLQVRSAEAASAETMASESQVPVVTVDC